MKPERRSFKLSVFFIIVAGALEFEKRVTMKGPGSLVYVLITSELFTQRITTWIVYFDCYARIYYSWIV